MQLSETVKLYPTKYQSELIRAAMSEYISTVNSLVSDAASGKSIARITTADVDAQLPAHCVISVFVTQDLLSGNTINPAIAQS
mgnify:CR=1 FL=1